MLERVFQAQLVRELKETFNGCVVLKNDANYLQGFPDLLVLHGPRWAALEVKNSSRASIQPNQDFYVEMLNDMSYSAFVYPENKDAILYDLQQSLQPSRRTRLSKR